MNSLIMRLSGLITATVLMSSPTLVGATNNDSCQSTDVKMAKLQQAGAYMVQRIYTELKRHKVVIKTITQNTLERINLSETDDSSAELSFEFLSEQGQRFKIANDRFSTYPVMIVLRKTYQVNRADKAGNVVSDCQGEFSPGSFGIYLNGTNRPFAVVD